MTLSASFFHPKKVVGYFQPDGSMVDLSEQYQNFHILLETMSAIHQGAAEISLLRLPARLEQQR